MKASFPAVTVDYEKHFVEDGNLFTSAGISAGIDMAFKVVARHCGEPPGTLNIPFQTAMPAKSTSDGVSASMDEMATDSRPT